MEINTINNLTSKNETDNLDKIRQFDRNTNMTALILGKLLAENVEYEYWRKLGYENFGDFIAENNFSFSKRTAYNYVDLWKMFCKFAIEMEEFTSIPYSKMLKLKDVADEKNLPEWIEKAKTLSRTDLDLEVKELKCQNEGKPYIPMPKMYLCPDCNKWVIDLSPDEICDCGKSKLKGEDIIKSGMKKKLEVDEWQNK